MYRTSNPSPDRPCYTSAHLGSRVISEEKLRQNILQSRRFKSRQNFLISLHSLRAHNVGVEISGKQKFGTTGVLSNRRDDMINDRGVVRGEVSFDNVPSQLPVTRWKLTDLDSNFCSALIKKNSDAW